MAAGKKIWEQVEARIFKNTQGILKYLGFSNLSTHTLQEVNKSESQYLCNMKRNKVIESYYRASKFIGQNHKAFPVDGNGTEKS